MISLAMRRRQTQALINRDPWEVTVYPRRDDPTVAEASFSFTGRLVEVSLRGAPILSLPKGMPGEAPMGRTGWAIFAPYDTPLVRQGDEVRAVSRGGTERVFVVIAVKQRDERLEVIVDEQH